jgi:predicted Fe-Mo cluster-binding NifX family protein
MMKTAMPIKDSHICNHFTKAEVFAIFDEEGQQQSVIPNPALNGNCSGKAALVTMLQQACVGRVIVRNVGERMLAKLLDAKFVVLQVTNNRLAAQDLVVSDSLIPLLSAEQGRSSVNYEEKQAKGSGCSHEEHHSESHDCGHAESHKRCCRTIPEAEKKAGGRCCH